MKLRYIAVLTAGALICQAQAAEKTELKDQKERVSYSFGMNWGSFFKNNDIEVDLESVFQGIRDSASGKTTLLTQQEAQEAINQFRTEHMARQDAKRKAQNEENKAAGAKFLAENRAKEGVVELPSGLQYKILSEGDGPMPSTNDVVVAHYRGTLLDGTEFDSSYKRGQPFTNSLTGLIRGWSEGFSKLKKGSKAQLFIPSDLAYGERGSGQVIPPGSTLIFDVELLDIMPRQPPPLPQQPVTSDIIKVPSAEEMKKGAKIEVIKQEDLERLQKEQQQQKQ